jgi:hypothetical protein
MSFSGAELAAGKDCVFKVITEKIYCIVKLRKVEGEEKDET